MAQHKAKWTIRRRGKSWQVDCGVVNGKRVQQSFKTRAEAEAWGKMKQEEFGNIGAAAFELTTRQRFDAIEALSLLSQALGLEPSQLPTQGTSLQVAIEYYLRHARPEGGQRLFRELCDDYVAAKTATNRRPKTLNDLKHRFSRMSHVFGETPIHLITTADIDKWLDNEGYKGITRCDYRTHFIMLFNFARRRKLMAANPAEDVEKPILEAKMPGILTVDQCSQLMHAVEKHTPEMVPYFAVTLFAGLRPSEAELMDWAYINFTSRTLKIIPEIAKKRRLRYVDMSSNLIEWLMPHRLASGHLFFTRKRYEYARKQAKVPWSNDVLRHSFASYHLAHHENVAKTSMQLGHRDTNVLFNHYRDLVTREDAAKFWEIRPKNAAPEVIPLEVPVAANAAQGDSA
jgi:integrase